MKTQNDSGGFTVVEMLIVLTILAMLAAIAIPSAEMSEHRKLDTIQVELQDALDYAEALSFHTGAEFGVKFHVGKQWFAVMNALATPVVDPLTRSEYVVYLDQPGQPADVSLEYVSFEGRSFVAFNEKGIPDKSGEIRIRAGDSVRTLVTNTATAKLVELPITD